MVAGAAILAGGRGVRLKPVTDYLPKPLIPVAGVPIIERQAEYLKGHGVERIAVCAGYRAGQVRGYVEARGGFGLDVEIIEEKSPLGTGGAVRRAAPRLPDPFFVINGDTITDIDLSRMAPDSVACVEMRTGYGTVEASGGRVTGFFEKRHVPGVWMNAGIYCISRRTAARLPPRGSMERDAFPAMAARGALSAVMFAGARWASIDSHKDLQECSELLTRRGGAASPSGRRPRPETPRRRAAKRTGPRSPRTGR